MSPSDWLTLQSVPSPGPTPSEKAVPMPKLTVLAESQFGQTLGYWFQI